MSKLLSSALIISCAAFIIYALGSVVIKQRSEIGSLSRTVTALTDSGKVYTDKLGNAVTQRKALELYVGDLKRVNSELHQRIKALDISLKRAESATQSHVKVSVDKAVKTEHVNEALVATYEDVHARLHTVVRPDSTFISVRMTDTIVGVISIEPKRFLFIKWGIKSIQSDISNTNPYITITTDIAVKFKK